LTCRITAEAFDIRRLICEITRVGLRDQAADLQDHTGRTSISDGRSARSPGEDLDTTSFVILRPA